MPNDIVKTGVDVRAQDALYRRLEDARRRAYGEPVVVHVFPTFGKPRVALMRWLAVLLFLSWSPAEGVETFRATARDDGSPVVLRIYDQPCEHKLVRAWLYLNVLDASRFRRAVLTWRGRDWASCWVEVDGYVLSIDEEGTRFENVRRSAFRDEGV